MKLKSSLIVFSIIFFTLFNLNFVLADYNITFSPNTLVNLTGVKCLNQNNSDCSEEIPCNISILYQNNSFLIINQTMINLPAGFRNYDTGLTPIVEIIWSAVVNCANGGIEPFNIVVSYDEDAVDTHYVLYGLLGFFGIIFALYGFKKDKMYYVILPGFMFLLMGLSIIANGFPNLNNQYLSGGAGTVMLGIGASFIFYELGKIGSSVEEAVE